MSSSAWASGAGCWTVPWPRRDQAARPFGDVSEARGRDRLGRRMKDVFYMVALLTAVACGGGSGSGASARSPGSGSKAGGEPHESIGDAAAAQGGLAALGGAGNREDGGSTGVEVAMGAALRAEEVDRKNPVKLDGVLKE